MRHIADHLWMASSNSDSRYPNRPYMADVLFYPLPKPKTQPEKCYSWIKEYGPPYKQWTLDWQTVPQVGVVTSRDLFKFSHAHLPHNVHCRSVQPLSTYLRVTLV